MSQIDSGIKSLQGDDSDLITDISPVSTSTAGAIRKDMSLQNTGRFLAPLEKRSNSSGLLPLAPIDSARNKRFEITNLPTNNPLPSPKQIGLSMKTENRLEPLVKNLENASSTATFKGFTLSGKGSMFLKSNIKKSDALDSPKSSNELKNEATASNNGGKNVKSILRDSSLTDVRLRPDSIKPSDVDLEDRKSVRFNLNESTKGDIYKGLVTSDESSNDDNDDEDEEEEGNADWDFNEDVDGIETHVKEITMTLNRNAQQQNELKANENKDPLPTTSAKNLSTLFDRNADSGRIKPMYEQDTDSESVASIKSANNRRIFDGEKELKKIDLPKPISHRLQVFEAEEQQNEVQNDNAFMKQPKVESIQSQKSIEQIVNRDNDDLDLTWQEEKAKLERIFVEQQAAREKQHEIEL